MNSSWAKLFLFCNERKRKFVISNLITTPYHFVSADKCIICALTEKNAFLLIGCFWHCFVCICFNSLLLVSLPACLPTRLPEIMCKFGVNVRLKLRSKHTGSEITNVHFRKSKHAIIYYVDFLFCFHRRSENVKKNAKYLQNLITFVENQNEKTRRWLIVFFH